MFKWVKFGAGIAAAHITYRWIMSIHDVSVKKWIEWVEKIENEEKVEMEEDWDDTASA